MIIQFSHNGKELNISRNYIFDSKSNGYIFWSDMPTHKRKFIKHKGWYLENVGGQFSIEPQIDELYFWGEWEPQSQFELTGNSFLNKERLPHAIHYPLFSDDNKGRHNTDPFVFGNHFYYTNCKQKQVGNGKKCYHFLKNQ